MGTPRVHAAYSVLGPRFNMLYAHQHLHVDVGIIDYILRRTEIHSDLRRLVEAGFEARIMSGSD